MKDVDCGDDLSKILKLLENTGRVLILTHHNADIDAVGASIALYEFLGEKADLAVPDSISKGARDLANPYNFITDPSLKGYDLITILDCSSEEQLKPVQLEGYEGTEILIDHHSPGNLTEIADIAWVKEGKRSTSEMVYEILKNGKLDENLAKALICGIVADTSHLKLAGNKQFKYISELLERADLEYSKILSILHTPTDFSERVAKIKASSRAEAYRFDEIIVAFSWVGSFEAASARSLLRLGADIAIVFCPREDEMRISGRCKKSLTEKIHLAKDLFSEIEDCIQGSAGGHDAAASANGKNTDRKEIKNEMLKRLEDIFGGEGRPL